MRLFHLTGSDLERLDPWILWKRGSHHSVEKLPNGWWLRLFHHTELEHTPKPSPTGFLSRDSLANSGGLPVWGVFHIGVWHVTFLDWWLRFDFFFLWGILFQKRAEPVTTWMSQEVSKWLVKWVITYL